MTENIASLVGLALALLVPVATVTAIALTERHHRRRVKAINEVAATRLKMITTLSSRLSRDMFDECFTTETFREHVDLLVVGKDWHAAYPDEIWPIINECKAQIARSKITVVK